MVDYDGKTKVEIICPLYNAATYLLALHHALLQQKDVDNMKISYILTQSVDDTEKLLKDNHLDYTLIEKAAFSHSLTREKAAFNSDSEIVVFITQDIEIQDEHWLYHLITPIINGEAEACYSRQISKHKTIEKYTREKNYPATSALVSKADIERLGLKTFFFSDAASAIKTSIFKELNGYDGKNLPISEDMYFAYKLIMAGYRIKYCADSVIYHSHRFTLKQLYHRYFLTGMFMAQNAYLDQYGAMKAGGGLAKYVLKRAFCEFNLPVLCRFLPDMLARYFGMKNGKKHAQRLNEVKA